jgi:hypothetical protein
LIDSQFIENYTKFTDDDQRMQYLKMNLHNPKAREIYNIILEDMKIKKEKEFKPIVYDPTKDPNWLYLEILSKDLSDLRKSGTASPEAINEAKEEVKNALLAYRKSRGEIIEEEKSQYVITPELENAVITARIKEKLSDEQIAEKLSKQQNIPYEDSLAIVKQITLKEDKSFVENLGKKPKSNKPFELPKEVREYTPQNNLYVGFTPAMPSTLRW